MVKDRIVKVGYRIFGLAFLLAIFVMCVPVLADGNKENYEKALQQLWDGKYDEAAASFDAAGDYEDASLYADYCRAIELGEAGSYTVAVNNLLSLGTFRDSAQQAVYYQGLSFEAKERYEEAAECFAGQELFRDIADRLSGYPAKIQERDYTAADQYEQKGQLEKALDAFKDLGSYKDSNERASKIIELINERDYEKAVAFEEKDDILQAYQLFVKLGSYKDSKSHVEALSDEAGYREGKAAIEDGRYEEARDAFSSIGDYKDSSEILYILGVINHADDIYSLSEEAACYRFHEKYGLIHFADNTIALPEWDEIRTITDNCYRVKDGDYYGLVDSDGERLTMCNWISISSFISDERLTGFQGTEDEMSVSLLDAEGNVYVNDLKCIGNSKAGKWNDATSPLFSEGLVRAENQEEKWGYIDKEGSTVIEFLYQEAEEFANGYAAVKSSGKWGFIDPNGAVVIDFTYDEVEPFSKGGFAHVRDGDIWQVIDTSGNVEYFIDPLLIKGDGTEEETNSVKMKRLAQDVRYLFMQGRVSEAELLAKKAGDNPEVLAIFEENQLVEAKKKHEEGNIDAALSLIKIIKSEEANELLRAWSIEKAKILLDKADIRGAFDALKGYEEDPEAIAMEIEAAKALKDEGKFENAISILQGVDDTEAEKLLKTVTVENAKALAEKGQFLSAIESLDAFSEDSEVSALIDSYKGQVASQNPEDSSAGGGIGISISLFNAGVLENGQIHQEGVAESGLGEASSWSDLVSFAYGRGHVVGLRRDGTVLAAGDNTAGQCNVKEWSSITAISAGNGITLGIHADGTVSAAGTNAHGQCKVDDWKYIKAVSAGGFHSLGLREDGTVVAVGNNEYGQCNVSEWRDIVAVSAGYLHSVGLQKDGTVVSTGDNSQGQCDVSEWSNITAVAAGDFHTLGLTADGAVLAIGHNQTNECDVRELNNVTAIAAGGQNSIALDTNGIVHAYGYNEYKQLEISGYSTASPDETEEAQNNTYSDKETIQKVQAALNEKGYDCGTPDGEAGPKTQEAIQKYKTDNGLEASPVIDDILLESLGI